MPPPPPPPPPGPPSAPRPPPGPSSSSKGGSSSSGQGGQERSALLNQIQQGKRLKSAKNLMKDRSAPIIGTDSTSSSSKAPSGGSGRGASGGPAPGLGNILGGGIPKQAAHAPAPKTPSQAPQLPSRSQTQAPSVGSKTLPHPPSSRLSSNESSKPNPPVPSGFKSAPTPHASASTNGAGSWKNSRASNAPPAPPPSKSVTNGFSSSNSNSGIQNNSQTSKVNPPPPPPVTKTTNQSNHETKIKATPFNPALGLGKGYESDSRQMNHSDTMPNKPGRSSSFATASSAPPPPPGRSFGTTSAGTGSKPAKQTAPPPALGSNATKPKPGMSGPPAPPLPSTSFSTSTKPKSVSTPAAPSFAAPGRSLATANHRFPPPPPQFK